jgi:hypothetical protein
MQTEPHDAPLRDTCNVTGETDRAPVRPFSSFIRAGLSWRADEPPPTFEELGLEEAQSTSFEWQSNRNNAEFFAFFWHGEASAGWVREIHGLFGSSGELVLSTIEAAVEIELTRRAMAAPAADPNDATARVNLAGQWRALRFFAEAQTNNLMVFGHGVANLVLRTLALQFDFDAERVGGIKKDAFHPGSDEPGAWCSLNAKTVSELRKAADSASLDSSALVESLAALWGILEPLWSLRGVQYHRWRGESPGVTGINFVNRNEAKEENGVITRSLPGQTDYVEGERIVSDVVNGADAALRRVGAWMPTFLEAWTSVFVASKEANEQTARRL